MIVPPDCMAKSERSTSIGFCTGTGTGGAGSRRRNPGSCAEAGTAMSSERRSSFLIVLVHRSRPIGVGAVLRDRHLARRAAVDADAVERGPAIALHALEHQFATARGPARPLVRRAAGQRL